MNEFYDFMKEYIGFSCCKNTCKYCSVGNTFCVRNDDFEGIYWFYETDYFIIDIHDFFFKKEKINSSFPDMSRFITFSSSYIITGSGESFNPYQTLTANSLYVVDVKNTKQNFKFLLHKNFPYLSVGINFKQQMIDEYISSFKDYKSVDLSDMFFDTKAVITSSLEKIATSILNCKMTSPAAEIFFEAKAKEWLSITIDAFINKKSSYIPVDDEKALQNVANYLNDHYAIDVSQDILEKISMMSGTKLKNLFKQRFGISITEYSQRRRINIAEILLLNSSLEIKDIAESVGYSSHSKFSSYFKKYKGIYPREVKKIASKHIIHANCICDNCNSNNNFE